MESHDSSECGTRHSHVVFHIWMSHGWVMVGVDEWWSHMTHPSVGHVIVMSCSTFGWVMDESWRSHAHMNAVSHKCATWLIHTRDMTHLHMYLHMQEHAADAVQSKKTLEHSYVWHDSSIYGTWLIYVCHMTDSHAWHDTFIYVFTYVGTCSGCGQVKEGAWTILCVALLAHMCDVTHWFVCHDLFIHVTWLIHICIYICRNTQ